MKANRIYMDWEFLEDGSTVVPISVGMVTDSGDEYYAVNADMPWERICADTWLYQHVVPHLPLAGYKGSGQLPMLDRIHPAVKPRRQIRQEVRGFILSHPNPQLWGWYSDFDHVALSWLFGRMIDLPSGIPMRTNDVQQEADRLGVTNNLLPAQVGDEHDALADARHARRVHRFLINLETDRNVRSRELTRRLAVPADSTEEVRDLRRLLAVAAVNFGKGQLTVTDSQLAEVVDAGLTICRESPLTADSPIVIRYHAGGDPR